MLKTARWTTMGLLVATLVAFSFVLGRATEPSSAGGASGSEPPAQSNDQSKVDFGVLNDMYRILKSNYIEPDKVDPETLYQAAINGLLQPVKDTGTFYVDPTTWGTQVGVQGTFEGVGATVSQQKDPQGNDIIVVSSPIKDTPAERAGIRSGDIILEVDGESTAGWTVDKAVLKIRGPKGTDVRLKVRHTDGTEEEYTLTREPIRVDTVTSEPPGGTLKDRDGNPVNDLAYIHIAEFDQPSDQDLTRMVQQAVTDGKTGLILDLRNNPGGLLQTTVNIADVFLDSGTVLVEVERDGTEHVYNAHPGGVGTSLPIVVLLNRFSASGSEVLAASLHDNGRATIIGEKSFGKGTVNVSKELPDGGALFVTVARWLTPKRVQIDGVGIRPDVPVTLSDDDIAMKRDSQLLAAIDELHGLPVTPSAATATPEASGTATTPSPHESPSPGGQGTPLPTAAVPPGG